MLNQLESFFGEVTLSNILEIGIVAAFFFVWLSWFRLAVSQRAARNGLITIFLYATIYLLTRLFGLHFVELVVERSFILFLIAMIVVFQTELHRMIGRVGSWRLFTRSRTAQSTDSTIQTLTEASFGLADRHFGALIAIRGREPWEGYIEGGHTLDGRLSLPLLYSIFDPDSPGHDGAVLIEDSQVTRFGAHLPLSSRPSNLARFSGTRHAAARGLSEVTDALVIVVSEEQGTVSIAEKGRLDVIPTTAELQRRLEAFWALYYSPTARVRAVKPYQQLVIALISILLATILWFSLTAYETGKVFRTYFVRIELTGVPDSLVVSNLEPSHVHVTLTGTSTTFRALNLNDLLVVVHLDHAVRGTNVVQLTRENVQAPPDLEVYEIEPQIITIQTRPAPPPTTRGPAYPGIIQDPPIFTGFRVTQELLAVPALERGSDPPFRSRPGRKSRYMSPSNSPRKFLSEIPKKVVLNPSMLNTSK